MDPTDSALLHPPSPSAPTPPAQGFDADDSDPRFWFHFYFVLAMFDVVVIVASILAHHTTLASFDAALEEVDAIHHQHRWLAELRTAAVSLNAPGNDIFDSRDREHERAEFQSAGRRLEELLEHPPTGAAVPDDFVPHIQRMVASAQTIFEHFDSILDSTVDPSEQRRLLGEATRTMAAMDRAQADALATITQATLALHVDQGHVLDRHQAWLNKRTTLEAIFIVGVVVILAGIFWYGRKLQRMRQEMRFRMRQVNRERRLRLAAVGEVCAACVHAIRNPVASIAASAQLISQFGEVDAASQARAKDIMGSCMQLNERITRMLGFARATSLELESLRPEDILDQALNEVRLQLEARQIRVERNYDSGGCRIRGDRGLLSQAVMELISNAMDHLPAGGRIQLVCLRQPRGAEFMEMGLIDNGPGIPEEIRGRVCELFFTCKPGGHGIGLATVKRAAELHGGSLVFASATPTGADIRMRLPVR